MKLIKTCSIFIVILLILGVGGFIYAKGWYNDAIFERNEENVENIEITITEGEGISEVAEDLENLGLIKSGTALKIYLKLENLNPNIKVGTYSIPSNSTVPEIISFLEQGVLKPATTVTIKEGLTNTQIGVVLSETLENFDGATFTDIVENPDNYVFSPEVQTFLNTYKPAGKPLLGFLYPDTYRFDNDQTMQSIVETMIQNFITKAALELNLTNLALTQSEITNLYDALILASVIEKEASGNDNRAMISSVFHNRLQDGYLLQSDATINFITGKFDPGVLIEDTKIDSPYNTYLYTGLMPTPINNPRLESIKASLYPEVSDYYYFFHTDEGETFYSETLEEHNSKVQQYRGPL